MAVQFQTIPCLELTEEGLLDDVEHTGPLADGRPDSAADA